jgi:hypothetical protein
VANAPELGLEPYRVHLSRARQALRGRRGDLDSKPLHAGAVAGLEHQGRGTLANAPLQGRRRGDGDSTHAKPSANTAVALPHALHPAAVQKNADHGRTLTM